MLLLARGRPRYSFGSGHGLLHQFAVANDDDPGPRLGGHSAGSGGGAVERG
ncbi:hypothetical protein RQM47_16890 [Rubrivirga sp. S365]|uniref:hypothetical protein n=1 Tax=Rubrivirga sp. S365 TaxID=3076080 RepID=UPI0028C8D777|nr:hypothetical protein [Rubrivirga sp. S365]MDT7858328.1 hypothetical protein [Rubrivirga sp. S365]